MTLQLKRPDLVFWHRYYGAKPTTKKSAARMPDITSETASLTLPTTTDDFTNRAVSQLRDDVRSRTRTPKKSKKTKSKKMKKVKSQQKVETKRKKTKKSAFM